MNKNSANHSRVSRAAFLKLGLWLALTQLWVGCGGKSGGETSGMGNQPMNTQQFTCTGGQLVDNQSPIIIEEILKLEGRFLTLTSAYHERYQFPSLLDAGIIYPGGINLGPERPLRTSETILTQYFNELIKRLEAYEEVGLRPWLYSGARPDFSGNELTYQSRLKFRVMVAEYYGLSSMGKRLKSALCRGNELRKNKKNDIASFLILKNNECSGPSTRPIGGDVCLQTIFTKWGSREVERSRIRILPYLIDLCTQVTNSSRENCLDDIEKLAQQKLLWNVYREWSDNISVSRYTPLFMRNTAPRKFKCTRSQTTSNGQAAMVTMEIPLIVKNADQEEFLTRTMNSVGASYWRRGNNFNIKFVKASGHEPNLVTINLIEGVSHVMHSESRDIKLSRSVLTNTALLRMTLAHELGHVFGFPDCYIEYMIGGENRELIYYEADNSNLMCSMQPGNALPTQYFDTITSDICQF